MVDNNERHREQAEADSNSIQLVVSDHFQRVNDVQDPRVRRWSLSFKPFTCNVSFLTELNTRDL